MLDGSSTFVKPSPSPADEMTNCQTQSSERSAACNRNASCDKFAVTSNHENLAISAATLLPDFRGNFVLAGLYAVVLSGPVVFPIFRPFFHPDSLQWSSFV